MTSYINMDFFLGDCKATLRICSSVKDDSLVFVSERAKEQFAREKQGNLSRRSFGECDVFIKN